MSAAGIASASLMVLMTGATPEGPGTVTLMTTLLLIPLTIALLIAEFILASGGILAVAAILTGVAAIVTGFLVSSTTGLLMVVLIPVVGALVVRWGLARLARSSAVPQTEIREDAGYHHLAGELGVAIGSIGELVTDAMPSGRARFSTSRGTGEIDVRVLGPVLSRGDQVVVTDMHGASVTVSATPAATAPS